MADDYRRYTVAIAIAVAICGGGVTTAVASEGQTDVAIKALLRDLESPGYEHREAAEATLRGLGAAVAPFAESFRPRTAEGAIRSARLFAEARAARVAGLAEAARGGDAAVLERLPGDFRAFETMPEAPRAWLAAAIAGRLSRLPTIPKATGEISTALWTRIPHADLRDPVPHAAAAMLYGVQADDPLSISDAYRIKSWLLRSPVRRAFAEQQSAGVMRTLTSQYVLALPEQGQAYLLEIVLDLELEALGTVARNVLRGQSGSEQVAAALSVLGGQRRLQNLESILPHVETRDIVARSAQRSRGVPVSVADVAIVAAALSIGEDPAAFGYADVKFRPDGGFEPASAHPRAWGATGRARRQLREWVDANLPDQQPAPESAVVGRRL